mmetsp:Transcript_28684/g.87797  ORF Transcript_28684/g.87797 Transcript_28684/m.87797 type:complete len:189 (+) Transcript_28684:61-627(+)
MTLALVLLLTLASRASGYCGSCGRGCAEGCENVDFGSCGNACCKLDLKVSLSTDAVMTKLNATLTAGGPDGNWSASTLDEGVSGLVDLRFAQKGVDYVGQYVHTTFAGYRDSVSLWLAPHADGATTARLFSYSLVGGAFGDSGQGFLNLKMLVDSLQLDDGDYTLSHADTSCPDPAVSERSAPAAVHS